MPPACPLLFYTSQSLPTVARPETVGRERTNRTPGRALPDPSQGTTPPRHGISWNSRLSVARNADGRLTIDSTGTS